MHTNKGHSNENLSKSLANVVSQNQREKKPCLEIEDNRLEAFEQKKLSRLISSQPIKQLSSCCKILGNNLLTKKENTSLIKPINTNVGQRHIYYGGDQVTNFSALWKEVRLLLKSQGRSVYRRRAELKEMYDENTDHQFTDSNDLIKRVYGSFDTPKITGRVRPSWDSFWTNVPVPKGYHRRHIIMSSLMRKAIYSVTDANIVDSQDNLIKVYQELSGSNATDISSLEEILVSAMHNNKFNIFLGVGSWNSAIGGLANESFKNEKDVVKEIKSYCDKGSLDALEEKVDELWEVLANANTFGNNKERDEIANVYDQIFDQSINDIYGSEDGESYETACNNLISMIENFYDSMAFDPSQASSDEYRMAQNDELSPYHGAFFSIISSGDLNQFKNTFNGFMELEKKTLSCINSVGNKKWMNAITQ